MTNHEPHIGPVRAWIIAVRFWPLFFIVVSGIYTWWVTTWVMAMPDLNQFSTALPAAAHLFTGQLIMKFTETRGGPPPVS